MPTKDTCTAHPARVQPPTSLSTEHKLPLRASHAPGDVPKLRFWQRVLVALQAVSVQQLGDHCGPPTSVRSGTSTAAASRDRRGRSARPTHPNRAAASRPQIDRALAAAARPSRPAARERLVRRQFTQTALDGRCRDTRGSGDQRRAAITGLGLSRRPHPARSLREHGRQRCMLCPQGSQLHGRSVLLADQQYKQLFPYSL